MAVQATESTSCVAVRSIPTSPQVPVGGMTPPQQARSASAGCSPPSVLTILLVYLMMVLAFNSLVSAVHHPVQPAAGGHRRLPGPAADRPSDRPECPD